MEKAKIIKNAMNYVNKLLLPLENHYYHHYDHALDVMERAIYLGGKEKISDHDLFLVTIASLFHDTGFIITYDKNEFIGAKIAKNYLRTILMDEEDIIKIENLILATDPDFKNPKNILEKIIKDADLDNLGREDFFDKGDKLKKELEIIKDIKIKDPEWHHSSLDLLYEHSYHTESQKKERDNQKQANKEKLEKMLRK